MAALQSVLSCFATGIQISLPPLLPSPWELRQDKSVSEPTRRLNRRRSVGLFEIRRDRSHDCICQKVSPAGDDFPGPSSAAAASAVVGCLIFHFLRRFRLFYLALLADFVANFRGRRRGDAVYEYSDGLPHPVARLSVELG